MATLSRPVPHPPHHPARQGHTEILPAAAADQLDDYGEAISQPVGGIQIGPRGLQDHHHVDMAYHGVVDYHPLPLLDPPIPYMFPDGGIAQGIPVQGRPNPLESQERGYGHTPLYPALSQRIPDQPSAENLRQLAIRYVHRPDSQVDLISMEPSVAGLCKIVIIPELADIV